MTDFLLEVLSEEIPARMQAKARADLQRLFTEQLAEAGLKAGDITVYSTPRRLALIAKALPTQTEAVSEESKGPPEAAPDQAIDGFCRKNGVTRDQLEVRDVKGRPTYFAVINKPGRDTNDVLAEAIPTIIKAFPWPKSMRWGDASQSTESLRWVRPLSGILAIFGDDLVECEIDGVTSGFETVGHRFHHGGMITIGNAGDYAEKLHACHVLVDHEERQNIIRDGAAKAASDAGLDLVEDEGLVIENAGLTEWPVPLLGSFDPAFLDVPEEVIQLTARVNQKYFVCTQPSPLQGRGGSREAAAGEGDVSLSNSPPSQTLPPKGERALAPYFVCTANIDASDGGKAIIAGNEKVLAARLSDAKFFWELDQKTRLEDHAKKLSNIVFHEKLGTVADKVERVVKLAEWLASLEGTGLHRANPEQTQLAARLCKADLVTEMVGEFPELQGLMGGYYAEKEGLPAEVSHAIRDHYKPVGQGDDVPTDPVTVYVSLADKLDTLVGFWRIGETPTGSKDPFALRRAALSVIRLVAENKLRFSLNEAFYEARDIAIEQFYHREIERRWPIILEHQNASLDSLAEILALKEGEVHHIASIWKQMEAVDKEYEISEKSARDIASAYVARETQVEYQATWVVNENMLEFFADRLKVQQREAGVRHDLIDAVFALGGEDDLVRLLARVKALQAFVETDEGTNLLAGYKRASNILKKEMGENSPLPFRGGAGGGGSAQQSSADDSPHPNPSPEGDGLKGLSYTPEKAEKALIDALDAAQPKVTAAIAAEEFETAMTALANLRAPIDQFFEDVTVNDSDDNKRQARLALLARFRAAVHQVADFSRIEG